MWAFIKEYWWTILLFGNYALVILFSIVIVLKNKNPVKTLSFLFALAVLPFLGLLIYYFFGQDYRKSKIFEKKYLLDNEKIKSWRSKFSLKGEERKGFEEEYGEGASKIYKLLKNNERAVLTFDNQAEILINGEQKFRRLITDLENAKNHIHIEYFVVLSDELGAKIIELLCKKSIEGVNVRMIYDGVGSNISMKYKRQMDDSGVEHFPFMPVLFSSYASKLNYRDHRKIVIIDGLVGYVGGINLDKRYDNTFDNDRFWRDTHLRLQGGAVGSLQSAFLLSWNFVSKNKLEIDSRFFPKNKADTDKPVAIQIAASGPDTDWANIMEAMFCAINSARERVFITTPYFMPNDSIMTAMTTAARSGVDVRLILPYNSDSWAAQYASDSYIEQSLESGIRIFRYKKGFVHAKTMLIDNSLSIIGTANMDYRSFAINFEINAIIYDRSTNEQMANVFNDDLTESEEVELDSWRNRGLQRKLQESFSRLWAPLL